MFGIGMPEMILILAVALIVIGPKKLPDLAKSLGKAMGEFKKATRDLKESMQIDTGLNELKTAFHDLNNDQKKADGTHAAAASDQPDADTAQDAGTDQAADPVDKLKTAVERRNQDAQAADAGADGDPPAPASDPGSETRKG